MNKEFNLSEACANFEAHIIKMLPQDERKFVLTKENKAVIKSLVPYFCNQPGYDLKLYKGIYIMGPPGTGKTTLMKAFSKWPLTVNKFRIANCRDIQKEAGEHGFKALEKYSKKSFLYKSGNYSRDNGYIIYCFDDFGAEKLTNFYKAEINVMEEIIQDRWIEMEETGMITHATSNLKGEGQNVKEFYGIRAYDRLRQMFNFIELNGPSHRK